MSITRKRLMTGAALVIISIIFSVIIISNFSPKPMFHGDYPYYPDVESITNASDVIIVGEVVSARNVKDIIVDTTIDKKDKDKTPYTISTIKVNEVIKGNVKVGDIITVKQLGDYKSKPEETLYKMDGYLKKGTTELMFLCGYENSPYSPVNPAQGVIDVKDGNTLYSANRYSLFGYSNNAGKTIDTLDTLDTLDTVINEIKIFVK